MMTKYRLLLVAATSLLVFYAAVLIWEMDFAPAGCCALTWPTTDAAQAERLMAQTDPRGSNFRVQRATAIQELSARPADPGGWLRFAYAERLESGRMTNQAIQALELSYVVALYDHGQTPWRLAFLLDNWDQLGPQLRGDALAEIRLTRLDGATWDRARHAVGGVKNPAGRMTIYLTGLNLSSDEVYPKAKADRTPQ